MGVRAQVPSEGPGSQPVKVWRRRGTEELQGQCRQRAACGCRPQSHSKGRYPSCGAPSLHGASSSERSTCQGECPPAEGASAAPPPLGSPLPKPTLLPRCSSGAAWRSAAQRGRDSILAHPAKPRPACAPAPSHAARPAALRRSARRRRATRTAAPRSAAPAEPGGHRPAALKAQRNTKKPCQKLNRAQRCWAKGPGWHDAPLGLAAGVGDSMPQLHAHPLAPAPPHLHLPAQPLQPVLQPQQRQRPRPHRHFQRHQLNLQRLHRGRGQAAGSVTACRAHGGGLPVRQTEGSSAL